MKFQKFPAVAALILSSLPAFASETAPSLPADGTHTGGGGDASEARVNEIRVDLLKWISEGGPQGLQLPNTISVPDYRDAMNAVLAQNAVIVAFTSNPVMVAGKEKTCAGSESAIDRRFHIDCNISRFAATSPADQYRLVHHEYAGLAGIEQNQGAASDYAVSNQITEFLRPEITLKLGVKKKTTPRSFNWKGHFVLASQNSTIECDPAINVDETYDYSNPQAAGVRGVHIDTLSPSGDVLRSIDLVPGKTSSSILQHGTCEGTAGGRTCRDSVTIDSVTVIKWIDSDTLAQRRNHSRTAAIDSSQLHLIFVPKFLRSSIQGETLTWLKVINENELQFAQHRKSEDSKPSMENCRYLRQ